jgi:shikimate kinase
MVLSLIGFMGCGKSSVGRELARLLCCPFMDLDEVIEGAEGRSIPEIFASDGEAAFRRMEAEHLQILLDSHNISAVVALGGGTVMRKECAEMVREKTMCVYLRATVETLVRNLDGESENRPMLSNEEPLNVRVAHLLALRSGTYEQTAHMVIDTDGKSVEEIAMEIHRNLDKIS